MHALAFGHGRENDPLAGNIISLLVLAGVSRHFLDVHDFVIGVEFLHNGQLDLWGKRFQRLLRHIFRRVVG